VFYVLCGENEFGRSEELARLRDQAAEADPAMADLNTSIFAGSKLAMAELRHACDTIPFMTERRLVIVHGLLDRLGPNPRGKRSGTAKAEEPAWKKAFLKELVAYLPNLPETARLIFVEEKSLRANHPLVKLAQKEMKGRGFIKPFDLPKDGELPAWIQQRASKKEGRIDREATALLAALVGSDLRLLDQEIGKLLLYADGQPVKAQDVRTLVSRAREASIFDLVDCVGRRETARALGLLHSLLDDNEPPLYLLAMLARQIRILIQVTELGKQHLSEKEMAGRLKIHPYVAKKGLSQARNFDMAQLEAAHERIVDTDWAIKTGRIQDVLAMDTLVVDLTKR
jgi:DNA polymerase-3 subunit delta